MSAEDIKDDELEVEVSEEETEVKADSDQPMTVAEFFHPRVEEVAALLPRRLGAALLRSETIRR